MLHIIIRNIYNFIYRYITSQYLKM